MGEWPWSNSGRYQEAPVMFVQYRGDITSQGGKSWWAIATGQYWILGTHQSTLLMQYSPSSQVATVEATDLFVNNTHWHVEAVTFWTLIHCSIIFLRLIFGYSESLELSEFLLYVVCLAYAYAPRWNSATVIQVTSSQHPWITPLDSWPRAAQGF